MSDELRESWESWESCFQVAREFDAAYQGGDTWPPPIMTALVTAVRATTLSRLHPFTSHARLCLSAGPRCRAPDAVNAPAFVSLEPPGSYNVWAGKPYRDAAKVVFTTEDPELAAARVRAAPRRVVGGEG